MLVLGFALSLAPALLAILSPESALSPGSSTLALALLPWLALAGLPRTRPGPAWAVVVAAALPALALAFASDRAIGVPGPQLASTASWGLLLLALVAWAGARGHGRGYALAWCLLVPGGAALGHALLFVAQGRAHPSVALLGEGNALVWALDAVSGAEPPYAALVSVALLLLAAHLGARGQEPAA